MNNQPSLLEQVYTPIFEDSLLREIEQKSMLITATAGQGLIRMGQPITVVPNEVNTVSAVIDPVTAE